MKKNTNYLKRNHELQSNLQYAYKLDDNTGNIYNILIKCANDEGVCVASQTILASLLNTKPNDIKDGVDNLSRHGLIAIIRNTSMYNIYILFPMQSLSDLQKNQDYYEKLLSHPMNKVIYSYTDSAFCIEHIKLKHHDLVERFRNYKINLVTKKVKMLHKTRAYYLQEEKNYKHMIIHQHQKIVSQDETIQALILKNTRLQHKLKYSQPKPKTQHINASKSSNSNSKNAEDRAFEKIRLEMK